MSMPVVHPVVIGTAPHVRRAEVHVPAPVASALSLDGGRIEVAAGPLRETGTAVIRPQAAPERGASLVVHPQLLNRLHVPPGTRLHVRYDPKSRVLSLGPFVGILALRSRRGPVFGDHDPFFRALTRFGQRLAIAAYLFSPRDVDWQQHCVRGYTYTGIWPLGRWRQSAYPFPDVVYDRIQTRRTEWSPGFLRFRERLAGHVRIWFNQTGFFDKWRMHQELSKNPGLARLLPETERYSGRRDLERFLKAYRTVYLKPIGGSLGLGIVRIRRTGSGYTCAVQRRDRAVVLSAPTLSRLSSVVSGIVRERPYIIQQGLPLATWRGRPFDVRILMQRTAGGRWALTKMYSRVAAPGSFTSNLSRGGQGCRAGPLLRRVFGRRSAALLAQLRATGIECARQIERTLTGTVGELGLDLGIDRRGRTWLIEVNSKPFLQMTREAGSPQTLSLSVQRPLRFAKYMAGFENGSPETLIEEKERS
ncbi:MAG: YheC/YheD family protein [Firmicutes bacterium]|nr:YheC/YheD family protein [Bacillota bacterium]